MRHLPAILATLFATAQTGGFGEMSDISPPKIQNGWILPASDVPSEPIWGIKNGIAIGLWPLPGPRGLIRIYTPYLGQKPKRVMNFIAIEPVIAGKRGYSELERSQEDNKPGKPMWVESDPLSPEPKTIDGVPTLTFRIHIERFHNGAHPIIEITLRQDRPHEVSFRTLQAEDSAPMDACILTATMGNYARLRRLHLKDKTIEAQDLWPNFNIIHPHILGFAPHKDWPLDAMMIHNGQATVSVTPNESTPQEAAYQDDTPPWWKFEGQRATQYWRTPAHPDLRVRVNARRSYWGTKAEIPGGISFENFELELPFNETHPLTFGISPL